jgi:2-polyprenyl-3-methyl-5-hydroxy-6-metoxy-1,4-benzoquinol methylase
VQAACPLCDGLDVKLLFRKLEIPYSRCQTCQFVFSRPERNPNLANSLDDYEASYVQYLEDGPEDERNFEALLEWMTRSGQIEGKRLLDVGCGSGKFVRFLRARQVEAFGTEPSEALYSRYLSEDGRFFPLPVDRLLAEPAAGKFGVITAFDVLEHVEQPVGFLGSIAQLLEEGGVLYLSTPDLGSLSAKLLGRRWHFFNRYHLSYFTKDTLRQTARRFGLTMTSFARRGRIRSAGYMLRFGLDFLLAGRQAPIPGFLDRVSIPVNLFDTMYLSFRKVT